MLNLEFNPNPFNQLGGNPFFDFQGVFGTPNTNSTPVFNPNLNPATWGNTSSSSSAGNTVSTVADKVQNQLKFDQIIALISQGVSAWGRNPSTQVYSGLGTVQGASTPQPSYSNYGTVGQQPQPLALAPGYNTPGSALGSGLDGIVSWATQNPVIVFAGIAGVYLLMREPPRSRR